MMRYACELDMLPLSETLDELEPARLGSLCGVNRVRIVQPCQVSRPVCSTRPARRSLVEGGHEARKVRGDAVRIKVGQARDPEVVQRGEGAQGWGP